MQILTKEEIHEIFPHALVPFLSAVILRECEEGDCSEDYIFSLHTDGTICLPPDGETTLGDLETVVTYFRKIWDSRQTSVTKGAL